MTKFFYKAKNGPTKIVDGFIEAQTKNGAIKEIVAMGLTPLDVMQAVPETLKVQPLSKPVNLRLPLQASKSVSAKEVVFFTRQISDLIEASVPILRVLQIVSHQTHQPYFKDIIGQMHGFVQNGGSLSGALAQHPKVFPSFYVNMVKTGEVGGHLDKVLKRLSDHLEKEHETRSKVISSLAYPALVLVVGILTVFVLLTFVIPRLSVMFEDLDQALPLPTVILMSVSGFFARFWLVMVALVVFAKIYWDQWARSAQGRLWLDQFKLKIPLLGEFIKNVELGRFSRTLGTLLESGVTLTTALNAIAPTIDNIIMQEEIKKVSREVTEGQSLRAALTQCAFFPEMVVDMVGVGEETGRLEKSLFKIAETLERQTDETVKVMLSLLGPFVLMVIVALVGFAVIAMLLPIFRMNLMVQ